MPAEAQNAETCWQQALRDATAGDDAEVAALASHHLGALHLALARSSAEASAVSAGGMVSPLEGAAALLAPSKTASVSWRAGENMEGGVADDEGADALKNWIVEQLYSQCTNSIIW